MGLDRKVYDIDGWMADTELEWLYRTASRVPVGSLIVEIGAWMGRSSAAIFLGSGKDKTVVSIDTWKGSPDEPHELASKYDIFTLFAYNLSNLGIDVQEYRPGAGAGHYYLTGDSIELAAQFADQSIAWLFYDGSHSMTGENLDAWVPKMKPDGLLAGHDYFCFYESIQQEIHKRFYIHQIHHSIWVKYMGNSPPSWL
jgi:hypothetical protein